jgi:hypothetical protein
MDSTSSAASAGTGGVATGTTGTAGIGGAGTGGADSGICAGGVPGAASGSATSKSVQESCYVAEVQPDGHPKCLPANDPAVLPRVRNSISSCGFLVEFVIDASADVPLPAECEPLVACCSSITPDDWRRADCETRLHSPQLVTPQRCANDLLSEMNLGVCRAPDAGAADASTQDAAADGGGVRHALCCYHACGSFVCT